MANPRPPHLTPESAAKRQVTIARNKADDRTAKLGEIRRQVAEGTLVIRQMTPAERTGALGRPSKTSGPRSRSV
jgi:hypothetical protein